MSRHPFDSVVPMHLDKETRDAIAATKPIPHTMPSRPFSAARALWLCRASGCSWWNAPDATHCAGEHSGHRCNTPRSEG